jgi:hypothetical protein
LSINGNVECGSQRDTEPLRRCQDILSKPEESQLVAAARLRKKKADSKVVCGAKENEFFNRGFHQLH